MTLTQLLQLYAPLAGLLAVVFWLGVLSQRVKSLEEDLRESKGEGGARERLVRLETKMDAVNPRLDAIDRVLQGLQRQLGNIVSGKAKITSIETD